ncbi:hypothetical protein JSY13_04280 [Microbacterium neungamense]|nr:hypothetical protein [Microbacterium neungamense]UWF78778.1 hypothetical protein JSY13_04280 [Microbacterium neungamense]
MNREKSAKFSVVPANQATVRATAVSHMPTAAPPERSFEPSVKLIALGPPALTTIQIASANMTT